MADSDPKEKPEDLIQGSRLDDFEVVKLLGRGGMGDVYLCTRQSAAAAGAKQSAAVKLIASSLINDRESRQRFFAEATALQKIQHPNVVQLISYGELTQVPHSGRPYIAMEFIDGLSVHRLARSNRVTVSDAIKITIDIAHGLSAIHNQGIIHRDIKPANAMVDSSGSAKLLDLGIAKPSLFSSDQPAIETQTGMIIGTINYIAPELLSGQPATVQSDIYALGLFVWELLNGTTPFKSNSVPETIRRVTSENLSWNQTVLDLSPAGLVRFLNSMLSKSPNKRPLSAKVVAEMLEGFLRAISKEPCLQLRSNLSRELSWPKPVIQLLGELATVESEWPYVLRIFEHSLREKPISKMDDLDQLRSRLNNCIGEFKVSVESIKRERLLTITKQPTGLSERPIDLEGLGHTRASPAGGFPQLQPLTSSSVSNQKQVGTGTSIQLTAEKGSSIKSGNGSQTSKWGAGALASLSAVIVITYGFLSQQPSDQTIPLDQNPQIDHARTPSSDSHPEKRASPLASSDTIQNPLERHPGLKVGAQLRYTTTQISSSIARTIESELEMVVEDVSDKAITYRMNQVMVLNVPTLLFAGDFFVDSNFAADLERTHFEGSTEGLYPPEKGRELAFSIVHNINLSRENIQCIVVDVYNDQPSGHVELEIECNRQYLEPTSSRAPVLRRRHKESYVFDATRAVVKRVHSVIESFDETGGIIGTVTKTRKVIEN